MKDVFDLIGRILIACMFLYEALDSWFYMSETKAQMTQFGVTWEQELLLRGAIIVLLLGSLMVLTGYRASFGALLLLLYWIPVTFIIHDFWNKSGVEARTDKVELMRALSIAGGLLIVVVNGSGRFRIKKILSTTKVPKSPW